MKLVLVDNIEQVLETALRRKPVPLVNEPARTTDGGKEPGKEPEETAPVRRHFPPPVDQPPAMAIAEPRLATWDAE
jgi:hypothetical protein